MSNTLFDKPRLVRGKRVDLGSCNFCGDIANDVSYEIKGESLNVRFCPECLKSVVRRFEIIQIEEISLTDD